MEQVETERLVLEPLLPEHAPALFPLVSDARLYEYMDGEAPSSVAELLERYVRWSGRRSPDGKEIWLNWAARLRGTDSYVGWLQATVSVRNAQLAYVVFVPSQRQGFAREACEALVGHLVSAYGVTRLEVTIDPRNTASIRLAESLGFARLPGRDKDLRLVRDVHHRPPL